MGGPKPSMLIAAYPEYVGGYHRGNEGEQPYAGWHRTSKWAVPSHRIFPGLTKRRLGPASFQLMTEDAPRFRGGHGVGTLRSHWNEVGSKPHDR